MRVIEPEDRNLLYRYYFIAKTDGFRGFIKALLRANGYDYDEKYDQSFGTVELHHKHERIPE